MKLVLGTMPLGTKKFSSEEGSFEFIDAFRDFGSDDKNVEVDTAFKYAKGDSERIIGKYPRKNQCMLATKANPYWNEQKDVTGLGESSTKKQLEISLERLQVDSVDLFYLHAPDHETPIEETLKACNDMYLQSKFKRFGLSNYAAWQVAEIVCLCRSNGWMVPTVYQGMYNALTRDVEKELIPCLRKFGISFYLFNPLAGGLLSGKYSNMTDQNKGGRFGEGERLGTLYSNRYWNESFFRAITHISTALNGAGDSDPISLLEASMRWITHHSSLSPQDGDAVVLGASSTKQLTENMKALRGEPLQSGVVKAFDEAWQMVKPECSPYFR